MIYDMHSHIIPAIDDGATDLDTAAAMLGMAAMSGTTHIVATPHVIEGSWLPSWEKILNKCSELNELVTQKKLDLMVYPGAEVAISMDILNIITEPGSYCINGSRYLLVELPATHIPDYTDDFFFKLQARGITPVLAHPERHPVLAKQPEILAGWINKGILTQLNTSSLTGKMGERTMQTAEFLIANNMIHIVGSDAHSIRTRNTKMKDAIDRLASLSGPAKLREIISTIPRQIINDEEVAFHEIKNIQPTEKPSMFKKIFTGLWR